jgi:hypothetical protein
MEGDVFEQLAGSWPFHWWSASRVQITNKSARTGTNSRLVEALIHVLSLFIWFFFAVGVVVVTETIVRDALTKHVLQTE